MTKREAAIIETYTGICMLVGDDRQYAYEYASGLIGRPIFTHEFAVLHELLKEKSKPDFINICNNLEDEMSTIEAESVRHGKWEVGYFRDRVCSCCLHPDNFIKDFPHDYCPNCGAKMDSEESK